MSEVIPVQILGFLSKFIWILVTIVVATYIYLSIVTMLLAKKTGTRYSWLAWIPIANSYLYSQMAGMHWWPVFLLVGLFIPYLWIPSLLAFVVFNFIWFWKILDKLNKPGWWVLLSIIPIAGWLIFLILLGVTAWSDDGKASPVKYFAPATTQTRIAPRSRPAPQKVSSPRLDRVKKLKGSLK